MNTITVSIPRYEANKHTNITSVRVDPDNDHLELFRGGDLHAVYRRGAWDHFVVEPDEDNSPSGIGKARLLRSDEQKAADEALPDMMPAIIAFAERLKFDAQTIITMARMAK